MSIFVKRMDEGEGALMASHGVRTGGEIPRVLELWC